MYVKLAWRNIWRNRRRTLITMSSIMFAVVFALFIESLERGAHNLMVDNMTDFHTGYLQIQDYRYEDEPSLDNAFQFDSAMQKQILEASENIDFIVPRIETFMLAAGQEQTRGAIVLGIQPSAEQQLNSLKNRLTDGRFFESDEGAAVLGEGLANRLNIGIGDSLALLGQGRFGMTASGLYEITGLINHPINEMNNQVVYISLPDAQWMLSAEDRITHLLINPGHISETELLAEELKSELPNDELRILTWKEMMPELLEALEFDRVQTRFFMLVLYVVIGFGIFGTILTMTLERLREFGILLSVGMKRMKLGAVVFIETFFISILGILSGFGVGLIILLYFSYNPIVLKDDVAEIMLEFGLQPIIPVAISPDIFLWQGLIVFLITTVICFYPTLKIVNLGILDAART